MLEYLKTRKKIKEREIRLELLKFSKDFLKFLKNFLDKNIFLKKFSKLKTVNNNTHKYIMVIFMEKILFIVSILFLFLLIIHPEISFKLIFFYHCSFL